MQQKESFLKTKKGKIVVGSVVGSLSILLVYLTIAYIIKWFPFSPSITEADVTKFGTDVTALVKDKEEADKAKNNAIVTKVETKINELKTQVENVNKKRDENKKIAIKIIEDLKTAAVQLKDKETKDAFKTEADKFIKEVDKLVTDLKKEINK